MIANFFGAEAVHAVIFSTIPIIRGNQKEDATVQKFIREMAGAYRGFEKSTGYIWIQYVYGLLRYLEIPSSIVEHVSFLG